MILNFSIRNFRSINEEVTLSFEPVIRRNEKEEDYKYHIHQIGKTKILKTAIIYGPNASGKTNILYGIDFFRNFVLKPPTDKTEKIDNWLYKPFLFEKNFETSLLAIEFMANNIRYNYQIEFTENEVVNEVLTGHNPKKYLIFNRFKNNNNDIDVKIGSTIDSIKKIEKKQLLLNTFPNHPFLSSFLKVNIKCEDIDNVLKWFKETLYPMIKPSTKLVGWVKSMLDKDKLNKKIALEVLKSADVTIEDYEYEERDLNDQEIKFFKKLLSKEEEEPKELKAIELKMLHKVLDKKVALDFKEDESRGTRRFFELAHVLALTMSKPCIIPIDEIESSLHPDLLKHFLILFFLHSKPGSQLILTTHSRELLEEMDILRHDFIWFTEKKEDGSTDLFALTDFGTKVIRDTSSVYNKYKIGKLGAIPNLKMFIKQNIDNEEKHGEKREKK